jgi:predicted metal-dependent hydrolase
MRRVSGIFPTDVFGRTIDNPRRNGLLWRRRTWTSAGRHTLGCNGLLRQSWVLRRAHCKPMLHPSQQPSAPLERWLGDNAASGQPVRRVT